MVSQCMKQSSPQIQGHPPFQYTFAYTVSLIEHLRTLPRCCCTQLITLWLEYFKVQPDPTLTLTLGILKQSLQDFLLALQPLCFATRLKQLECSELQGQQISKKHRNKSEVVYRTVLFIFYFLFIFLIFFYENFLYLLHGYISSIMLAQQCTQLQLIH